MWPNATDKDKWESQVGLLYLTTIRTIFFSFAIYFVSVFSTHKRSNRVVYFHVLFTVSAYWWRTTTSTHISASVVAAQTILDIKPKIKQMQIVQCTTAEIMQCIPHWGHGRMSQTLHDFLTASKNVSAILKSCKIKCKVRIKYLMKSESAVEQ